MAGCKASRIPRGLYRYITRVASGSTCTLTDFIRNFPVHVSHDYSDASQPTPSITERLFHQHSELFGFGVIQP